MHDFTIVFDLDGTLIDTAPDLTSALNHVLNAQGYPDFDENGCRPLFGQGARIMIERAFELHDKFFTASELDQFVDQFIVHYSKHLTVQSKPFPGVKAQLDRLKAAGATLAICTNKRADLAKALISDLSLNHYFGAVLGGDSLPVRKPDAAHIISTVETAGGNPGRAIMIGDSATDIKAARNANIPVIAVTFGYSEPEFAGNAPDVTIDHFDELPAALAKLTC